VKPLALLRPRRKALATDGSAHTTRARADQPTLPQVVCLEDRLPPSQPRPTWRQGRQCPSLSGSSDRRPVVRTTSGSTAEQAPEAIQNRSYRRNPSGITWLISWLYDLQFLGKSVEVQVGAI
jgi:hypothetical protein